MDNYFQQIFLKISCSQEDNSIFGCPHSFLGCRGQKQCCMPVGQRPMVLEQDRKKYEKAVFIWPGWPTG